MRVPVYCKLTDYEQCNVHHLFRRQILAEFNRLSDREFFELFSDYSADFAILVDGIATQLFNQRELF